MPGTFHPFFHPKENNFSVCPKRAEDTQGIIIVTVAEAVNCDKYHLGTWAAVARYLFDKAPVREIFGLNSSPDSPWTLRFFCCA